MSELNQNSKNFIDKLNNKATPILTKNKQELIKFKNDFINLSLAESRSARERKVRFEKGEKERKI